MKTRIKRVLTQMVSVGGAALIGLFLIAVPASAFSGSGAGTVADPYQITNATQLQEMKDNLNAHYVLMNDIDCSDTVNWNGGAGFEPIACWNPPCGDRPSGTNFRGSFDGQGHIITGLFISRPGENYVGLFGNIDQGTLKNVGLVDVDITGGAQVGALTGGTHYVTVNNCYSTGNVTGTSNVGGLVMSLFHSTVSNCYSTANVNGDSMVGGLASHGCDGKFINCYSTGDVSGNLNVGGLAGYAGCTGDGEIRNCYSTGNVSGDTKVGGLVGSVGPYDTVSNSYSTGNVTGISNVGGLVGKNDGTITNCYYNNHAGNPSVGIGSGSGDCTAIGNNESYFYYSSDPPMDVWDFVNVWGIDEGVSYPYLLWQPPSIIYVDADATGGANNGSSWPDAYLHLQDALAEANSNPDINDIRVAEGTYNPDANTANSDGTGDREAAFQLLNGVALYGGFPTGGGNWESRDTSACPTILSGDLDGNDVQVNDPCDLLTEPTRGENSYHVVTGSGTDATSVLDGFTITAGNANEPYPSPNGKGGGMYNDLGSPTVVNCTFSSNSAVDVGGGMSNYNNSGPTVMNCTFSGNSAACDGGGMDNENSSPTVTNCTFSENSADDGGGMCNANESTPTLTNCTFTGNSAGNGGGGMWNMDGSDPNLTDCTFSGNSAGVEGGGMDNDSSSPTLINCTFTGNSAASDGGGINNENSSPIVTNCAFIGNSTEDGGGMCNYSSSPTVTNCTFTGNSAISPDVYVLGGGGMCNVEYSSTTLTNCILWGNSSPEPNGPQIALKDNSAVSISYCDLQGGQTAIYKVGTNSVIWGEGNIDEDPMFIDPNGLDGIGGTADDEEGYVHLRGYSPCINAGDPGGDYSGQVDIDNQPRVAYGRVDMGADEVFPIAGDFEPDGDVDFADFAIFANHWLMGAE